MTWHKTLTFGFRCTQSAFPRIMKSSDRNELTPDNIEQVTLNFVRVYNHYMEDAEDNAAYVRAFAGAYAYS